MYIKYYSCKISRFK